MSLGTLGYLCKGKMANESRRKIKVTPNEVVG